MSYLRYVKIIGTMHVSPKSRSEVRELILKEKPDAVAIELDMGRFYALQSPKRMTFQEALKLGRKALLGYLLMKVEEKIGEEFGMKPGEEMLEAIHTASLLGVPLYLIDEDIQSIMGKLLKAPLREKILLLLESSLVFLPIAPEGESPEDIMESYKLMMHRFRLRYPYLFKVLVEDRNKTMARNLKAIVDGLKMKGVKKPKVIAVVGLGHKKGIERLLNSYKEDKAFIQQEQNNDR
ncbi:TraB/GumN family protein [Thermococcus aggregans]|uniref:TraB/GumN family protein n=1 Tax=Thermococcus aggregans TaxID=110163 RepID=A0A9E7SNL3_THEAG|nr:TraB/GumN family protein [Thermococcus aggregans]USS40435.1 TraB/GumN family protein [Thermococcus aggregans]